MKYWPKEISETDTRSPIVILEQAMAELQESSLHLSGRISESDVDSFKVLGFILARRQPYREVQLFEVRHRVLDPFPASMTPTIGELPPILRRSYVKKGRPPISAMMQANLDFRGTPDQVVTNESVCHTPAEFEGKMINILSSPEVSSIILNLRVTSPPLITTDDESTIDNIATQED